jgi:tetratricopeptide (TPR) repeat protein
MMKGDFALAEQSMRRALKLDPDYQRAPEDLAQCLMQLRKYQQAIPIYRTLLRENPEAMHYLALLGAAEVLAGQWDEGERHLLTAALNDSSEAVTLGAVALELISGNQYPKAIHLLRNAVGRAPDDLELRLPLIELLTACPDSTHRNPEEAVQLAQEAIRRTGGQDPLGWYGLALALRSQGSTAGAAKAAQQALALSAEMDPGSLPLEIRESLQKMVEMGRP